MATQIHDAVHTADGKVVRISKMNPERTIEIAVGGRRRKVKVKDIPYVTGNLSCGDIVRGIALQEGDIIFCEDHHVEVQVTHILAQ